jgi:2-hydroxychromene-2-carboxylate isomerase
MKHLDFWFDPVSPFAFLAFERLPQVLVGLSYDVSYRPILFAGLLKHWDQKGPAEIEPKRAWTFRHVHWQAHSQGIEMQTPTQHPFNPLSHLRLLLACAPEDGTPSRLACETVLRDIWQTGAQADDPQRLSQLAKTLAPRIAPDAQSVKQALKDSTARALALGIFGVPTIVVDGRAFWGVDSMVMLASYLRGDPWFNEPAWDREGEPRVGVRR